jgi:hypothetical protein
MHPAVLESYTAGELIEALKPRAQPSAVDGLTPVEVCVLNLLRGTMRREADALRPAV